MLTSTVCDIGVNGSLFACFSAVGLGIWDTKFGILKAWKPYPHGSTVNRHMYSIAGQLLTTCSKALYAFPCTVAPSTLLAVIGSRTKDENSKHVNDPWSNMLVRNCIHRVFRDHSFSLLLWGWGRVSMSEILKSLFRLK